MRRVLALMCLLLLSACGPATMSTEVTRFNSFPAAPVRQSFAFQPEGRQMGALEFQHNAELVSAALAGLGFLSVAPGGPPADLVVMLRYGVTGNHTEYSFYEEPGFGAYPGWTGFYPEDITSYTLYSHFLEVVMLDGPDFRAGRRRMVFQGRAIGESERRDINQTLPALVEALFGGFPGVNGQTVHVRVVLPPR